MFIKLALDVLACVSGGTATKTTDQYAAAKPDGPLKRKTNYYKRVVSGGGKPNTEGGKKAQQAQTVFKNIENAINPFFKGFKA